MRCRIVSLMWAMLMAFVNTSRALIYHFYVQGDEKPEGTIIGELLKRYPARMVGSISL